MSDESFFKVEDKVMYSAPDDEDQKAGKIIAILRSDSIVVEWEDGSISTVSENFLDLI